MDTEKALEYRRAVEDLKVAVKDLRSDFVDWEAAFERVTTAKERCEALRRELDNPKRN
jgi:hypothetical protein